MRNFIIVGRNDIPEGGEGLLKLTRVKFFVAIEVHSPEDDFQGTEAHTSFLLDCQLESEI